MFSLHTFDNYVFGTSEIDTPVEDPKLDGRFVERIRGSSRESLIGVVKMAGYTSDLPSMGPLKTARTPTAATLFGEKPCIFCRFLTIMREMPIFYKGF